MRSVAVRGEATHMQWDASLDEIVLFDLPSKYFAEQLLLSALSERVAWLQIGDEASIVGVLLAPDSLDLARLLREVQDWLERSALLALRFELDGRLYVLEAPLPVLVYA
jgi:hypothetical protein